LWFISGAQPYASTVEQFTHVLKPSLTLPGGIIFLHLQIIYCYLYILSNSDRI